MSRVIVVLFSVVMIGVLSCQKEIDWGWGNSLTTAKTIYRIKSKTGATDTTQVDFSFDGAKKLVVEKTTGISNGQDISGLLTIVRDSTGVITKSIRTASALILAGVDSIVTSYFYDRATSKYKYAVFALKVGPIAARDSAIFTYDSLGNIAKDEHYLKLTGSPIPLPPTKAAQNTYTYSSDGKNLLKMISETVTAPGGPLSLASTQLFTYDTKNSPLIMIQEAIILGKTSYFSLNNQVKTEMTNAVTPARSFNMDYTFKYNSFNLPDSSTGIRTPGGDTTASKYYYQ